MSAYVTSKAALIRWSAMLAAALRPHGLSVFAVQPGTVRTALAEDLLASDTGRQWLPWFQQIFESGQDVGPEPAADLVALLASGEADRLSGRFFGVHDDCRDLIRRA